jgi:peroxiredoxin
MKRLLSALVLLSLSAWGGSLAGKRAASFTLPDATGKFYDLLDYRGKIVLVDIMRTDCPHCLTLSKTLERVKAKYGDKIAILSIVNPPDSPQSVAQFIAKNKVSTPIVFDCGQAAAALLRITPQNATVSLPHLILIDPQGVVKDDWVYGGGQNNIFEGDGLFPVIDSMLKAGGK